MNACMTRFWMAIVAVQKDSFGSLYAVWRCLFVDACEGGALASQHAVAAHCVLDRIWKKKMKEQGGPTQCWWCWPWVGFCEDRGWEEGRVGGWGVVWHNRDCGLLCKLALWPACGDHFLWRCPLLVLLYPLCFLSPCCS